MMKISNEARSIAQIAYDCVSLDSEEDGFCTRYDRKCVENVVQQAIDRARNSALEDAALKMDELREIYKSSEYAYPNGCLHSQVLASTHADAIRAMKVQP